MVGGPRGPRYVKVETSEDDKRVWKLFENLYRRQDYAEAMNNKPYIDWKDFSQPKFYIIYDFEEEKLKVKVTRTIKQFGVVYFSDIISCLSALAGYEKELIWYFTEYDFFKPGISTEGVFEE